ncbi:recombinase family protein [Shewanella sp.]|uniref:recombinase family protein n=1 Tax=Shewanella sp. TaxID=50422 RepID=UPI003563E978
MSSTQKIKAYSYLRFSTPRQVQGDSYRRQIALARAYAIEHGLELEEDVVADIGVSAFRGANREAALGQFLEMVKSGLIAKGSYLLVESHDRLSREQVETALAKFLELINSGVVVVTLFDKQVYRSGGLDMVKLMTSLVYMSRANEESEMKSRRASAAWSEQRKQAASRGKKIKNSALPTWLDWDAEQLVLKHPEVDVVRRIFELALGGSGFEQIAAILNKENIKTFRKGVLWRPAGVGQILKSRSVIGEYQPMTRVDGVRQPVGEPIPDYYPAAISVADFNRVQRLISIRNKHSGAYRKGEFNYLFSGVIRCECGELLRYHNKGTQQQPRHYLVCPMKTAGDCDVPFIRYEHLEPQMLVAISHFPRIFSRMDRNNEMLTALEQQIAVTEDLIVKAAKRHANATQLLVEFPQSTELRAQFVSLESEVKALRNALSSLEVERDAILGAVQTVTLLTTDKLGTTESRRQFNTQLVQSVARIELSTDADVISFRYFLKDETLLCEQIFETLWKPRRGVELGGSELLDNQCMTVCKTIRDAPFIDTRWFPEDVELSAYPAIEGNDVFTADDLKSADPIGITLEDLIVRH